MPKANIEIKARCADLASARARAEAIATSWVGAERQVDTYFCTRRGRLKLRESSRAGAQLIPYLRPDQQGPKRSDYQLVPVPEPEETLRLLRELLGVHKVVRKQREIAMVGNVRIHLDRVEGLGTFLELEAVFDASPEAEVEERRKVDRLMEQLGIRAADLIDTSYEAMLEETE
ncbi:MAG: class IV adenylate cyclase [bacterium]|nr:class IV adenylate cyclase [bacterium]MCP5065064.1 class IV adenylate cyclase [bacterium]